MRKPLMRLLCLLVAAALLLAMPASAEGPNPTISPNAEPYDANKPELLEENQLAAGAALVMEESTGNIIFEKNIDAMFYPASTTKIMTVLLGILCCDLDEEVTVSWNAINVGDPDATMLGLEAGEVIRMEDLLYGTLLRSGNDGANVIAEHVSGTIDNFVALMNETARQLGMTKTHFVNAHGLHDPDHYTTARDLATLARYAMSNETFRTIAQTKNYTIPETTTHRQRSITTRHRIMLQTYSGESNSYYYAPMTGIKSGSHSQAAYCYVGSASREGVDLISVVLCSGRYDNMRDTKKLMEYGFSQYTSISVVDLYREYPISVQTSGYALDDQGLGVLELSLVPQDPTNSPLLTVLKGETETLAKSLNSMILQQRRSSEDRTVIVQYTRELVAPITAGETIGVMSYQLPTTGETVQYNMLATRSIPERTDKPATLEEIIARTEADPNPIPPITTEIVLLFLSPYLIVAVAAVVVLAIYFSTKRLYARLPKNKTRYVK